MDEKERSAPGDNAEPGADMRRDGAAALRAIGRRVVYKQNAGMGRAAYGLVIALATAPTCDYHVLFDDGLECDVKASDVRFA